VPSESDLRDLLQGSDPEGRTAIDLDAVLTRARRRRRPKVIAAQALGSVAMVAVLGTAVVVSLPRADETASMIAQDTSAGNEEAAAPFVDTDSDLGNGMLKAAECGDAPVVPPLMGWTVGVGPSPLAASGEAAVSVTLGLDAPLPESGIATIVALTVVDDGVVVGHAFPVGASVPIGPGAGEPQPWTPVTWDAVAPIESCDPAQPIPAGSYQVVVHLIYVADGGDGLGEPIESRPVAVEIR
jgi:hypothetical protein